MRRERERVGRVRGKLDGMRGRKIWRRRVKWRGNDMQDRGKREKK